MKVYFIILNFCSCFVLKTIFLVKSVRREECLYEAFSQRDSNFWSMKTAFEFVVIIMLYKMTEESCYTTLHFGRLKNTKLCKKTVCQICMSAG